MQNYTEIPSSTTLSDSLSQILNNDKTALSLSSGTSFPTVNLQLGMPCFGTDEQKLYILTVVSPASWKMIIDLSATVGKVANADLLAGVDSTGFALSGHNHNAAYGWLHDYFFNAVSNCFRSSNPSAGWQGAPNCVANTGDYYNCGDQAPYTGIYMLRLADGGSTISFGSQTTRYNCNCDCNCC